MGDIRISRLAKLLVHYSLRLKKGEVHKVDDVIWNTAGGVKAANLMLDDIEDVFLK